MRFSVYKIPDFFRNLLGLTYRWEGSDCLPVSAGAVATLRAIRDPISHKSGRTCVSEGNFR